MDSCPLSSNFHLALESPTGPLFYSLGLFLSNQVEEKAKFDGIFESLLPINGLLSGDKVKPVLMNSKLPLDVLGRVSGFLTSRKAADSVVPCLLSTDTP